MTTAPSERAKLFVDQCAAIVIGAVQQYGAIASRAAGEIDRGDFGAKEWSKSMTQLCDVALINSAAFATTVAAGPGARLAPNSACSDANLPKANHPRTLYIADDFKRGKNSPGVPAHLVSFVPAHGRDEKSNPLGLLSAGAETFRVEIHLAGLPGGTYCGTVAARDHAAQPSPQDDRVPVYVTW